MSRFVPLLLAVLLIPDALGQVASLPPRDEGSQDPTFIAFRASLLAAAASRDTTTILRAFAPDATISFGGDSGPQGVRDVWFRPGVQLEPGQDFWSTFARTLAMGSTIQGEITSAPYLFMGFPEGLDPFEHVVVVGESVRVRSEPSLSGQVLGSLTYQVVEAPLDAGGSVEGDGYTWVPIRLATGERAWVADPFVWSPIGHRIGFEKRGSSWTILYFVAGD